ncbi:hypothetical protein HanIR_Chr16g0837031 [Helianthus annuus]|nr:hypothetical protein HanIR_Chr16g0837031 [Helianthus annuus]
MVSQVLKVFGTDYSLKDGIEMDILLHWINSSSCNWQFRIFYLRGGVGFRKIRSRQWAW